MRVGGSYSVSSSLRVIAKRPSRRTAPTPPGGGVPWRSNSELFHGPHSAQRGTSASTSQTFSGGASDRDRASTSYFATRRSYAGSNSQPASTATGLARQSAASRHSSASAFGPGRSQTAATSRAAIRPKRASASGTDGAGSASALAPAARAALRQSS